MSRYLTLPVAIVMIDILGMRKALMSRPLEKIADAIMVPFADLIGPSIGIIELGNGASSDLTEEDLINMGYKNLSIGPSWAMVSDSIIAYFPSDIEEDDEDEAAEYAIFKADIFLKRAISIASQSTIWLRNSFIW